MDTDKMNLRDTLIRQVTDLIVEAWAKVCNESDAQHVSESKNAGNVIATGNEIQSNEEVKQNVPVVKKRKRYGTPDFYTPHVWRVKLRDCIMPGIPNQKYSTQQLIGIFGIKGQRDACARVTQFCTDLARACPGCVVKDDKPGNYSYTFNSTEKFMKRVNIGEELIQRIDKDGVEKLGEIKDGIKEKYGRDNSEIMFIGKLAACYIAHKKGMQPEVQDKDCIN